MLKLIAADQTTEATVAE